MHINGINVGMCSLYIFSRQFIMKHFLVIIERIQITHVITHPITQAEPLGLFMFNRPIGDFIVKSNFPQTNSIIWRIHFQGHTHILGSNFLFLLIQTQPITLIACVLVFKFMNGSPLTVKALTLLEEDFFRPFCHIGTPQQIHSYNLVVAFAKVEHNHGIPSFGSFP